MYIKLVDLFYDILYNEYINKKGEEIMKKFLTVMLFITLVFILLGCEPKKPKNNNVDYFLDTYLSCMKQERLVNGQPFNSCMASRGWYEDEDGNWFKK